MSEVEKFKATFENGGFWEYYKDLERQFEKFLEYVPYLSGNEETYSFRLANLILAIGAHIDSAFKEIAKYPEFSGKYPDVARKTEPTMEDYYPLALEYKLHQRKVEFKCLPEREKLAPFERYRKVKTKRGRENKEFPYWWTVYNKVKHHFKDNLKNATLKNSRDALAGAFLINILHKPSIIWLHKYHVVKDKYEIPDYQFDDKVQKGERLYAFISTNVFHYDYES